MPHLTPLTPPLALHQSNLSSQPQHLLLSRIPSTTTLTVNFTSGTPFLKVQAAKATVRNRQHVTSAVSGEKICDLLRKGKGGYSAQDVNGKEVLEVRCREVPAGKMSDGGLWELRMKLAGGGEELVVQGDSFIATEMVITYQGSCCGIIDSRGGGGLQLSVAAGLDPFLVAVLGVVVEDRMGEDGAARGARVSNVTGLAGPGMS